MSDSGDLTYSEYWTEVRDLAAEAWEDERAEEEALDWVWETVDGHEWVIYTAYNFDVLKLSPNDGYSAENLMGPDEPPGVDWARHAFGALYADVMEALEDRLQGEDR